MEPNNKELHFIVSKLVKDDDDEIIICELEAIINKANYQIDWKTLKNNQKWLMGWK